MNTENKPFFVNIECLLAPGKDVIPRVWLILWSLKVVQWSLQNSVDFKDKHSG